LVWNLKDQNQGKVPHPHPSPAKFLRTPPLGGMEKGLLIVMLDGGEGGHYSKPDELKRKYAVFT